MQRSLLATQILFLGLLVCPGFAKASIIQCRSYDQSLNVAIGLHGDNAAIQVRSNSRAGPLKAPVGESIAFKLSKKEESYSNNWVSYESQSAGGQKLELRYDKSTFEQTGKGSEAFLQVSPDEAGVYFISMQLDR